jgi:hypothetical protein
MQPSLSPFDTGEEKETTAGGIQDGRMHYAVFK